jgi:hypothetical protein
MSWHPGHRLELTSQVNARNLSIIGRNVRKVLGHNRSKSVKTLVFPRADVKVLLTNL